MLKYLIILIIFCLINMETIAQDLWAIAKIPAPVLNSPDFQLVFGGKDGKSIHLDESGLIREIEYIALPGTVFELIGEYDFGTYKIFHVKTDEYNYDALLYIDSRFVDVTSKKPAPREKLMPSFEKIYQFLDNAVGYPYLWGGNFIDGIPELLEYYKPKSEIDSRTQELWTLTGCDCSGLMYQATNGCTERNTRKLVNSGDPVHIKDMTADEIINHLKPLDMIVWDGHVIYVYDDTTAIQSSLSKGGVVKTNLLKTLYEVMESRTPVDDYNSANGERFVIRRWFKNN